MYGTSSGLHPAPAGSTQRIGHIVKINPATLTAQTRNGSATASWFTTPAGVIFYHLFSSSSSTIYNNTDSRTMVGANSHMSRPTGFPGSKQIGVGGGHGRAYYSTAAPEFYPTAYLDLSTHSFSSTATVGDIVAQGSNTAGMLLGWIVCTPSAGGSTFVRLNNGSATLDIIAVSASGGQVSVGLDWHVPAGYGLEITTTDASACETYYKLL